MPDVKLGNQSSQNFILDTILTNTTIDEKSQWSKKSQKIREKRFEEVVAIANDILKTHETRVVYIGF